METEEEQKPSAWATAFSVVKHIPGAALIFAVTPLLILGYFGWYYYGAEHLDKALYSLKRDNLEVTRQPDWIPSDVNVTSEVYDQQRLDRVSLLDPNANATIAQAFETNGWVKSATRITKNSGGTVEVDLLYREPIAMVYYQADPQDQQSDHGFYPVDPEGVILPTEHFGETSLEDFFLVFADDVYPKVGVEYSDARVLQALELCSFLSEQRSELGLHRIYVSIDRASPGPSPWLMTVITRDQIQIDWGHAPGYESVNETKAAQKLKKLTSWLPQARQTADQKQIDLQHARVPTSRPVSKPAN